MNSILYKNQERLDAEEAELKRLEEEYIKENDPTRQETPDETVPPVDPKDKHNWEQRYSDLRSFSQKQLNEKETAFKKEKEELQKKIRELEAQATRMPENAEEAKQWVKEYPDLARVLMTLMEEKTDAVREDIKMVRSQLEDERTRLEMERAIQKLITAHPDFPEIRDSQEFQDWVESQPQKRGPVIGKAIYDALYNNQTDADSAIEAVSLYKSDMKITKKKTDKNEAAQTVRRTSAATPEVEEGKPTFTESQIARMNDREFERLEDQIELAKREGRFVYDMSGAAR